MIEVLRKRFVLIFSAVIIILNVLSMTILLVYLHISATSVCREHLLDDIKNEFIPNYRNNGKEKIMQMYDDEYWEIVTKDGSVIGSTKKTFHFELPVDKVLLQKASAGTTVFHDAKVGSENYLMAYFPLDEKFAGRAVMQVNVMLAYRNQFLKLVLFSIPGMIAFSYITSRILVDYALKPAIGFCRFQENFLSNVAHELRSPLASLQGNLEVSLRKERPAEEYREVIRISLKETRRIINLLKNLHLLASSQTRPLDIFYKQVDFKKIISELVEQYRPQINAKKINLSVETFPDAACLCDESLMKRALENLFDNAVKYTPENGMIRITGSKDSVSLYVTIENTASNIQADEIKDLFEAFYRGRNAARKDIEGKGLGLYITRYILQSHNGDITATVTPDHLFSVRISLPIKKI